MPCAKPPLTSRRPPVAPPVSSETARPKTSSATCACRRYPRPYATSLAEAAPLGSCQPGADPWYRVYTPVPLEAARGSRRGRGAPCCRLRRSTTPRPSPVHPVTILGVRGPQAVGIGRLLRSHTPWVRCAAPTSLAAPSPTEWVTRCATPLSPLDGHLRLSTTGDATLTPASAERGDVHGSQWSRGSARGMYLRGTWGPIRTAIIRACQLCFGAIQMGAAGEGSRVR